MIPKCLLATEEGTFRETAQNICYSAKWQPNQSVKRSDFKFIRKTGWMLNLRLPKHIQTTKE